MSTIQPPVKTEREWPKGNSNPDYKEKVEKSLCEFLAHEHRENILVPLDAIQLHATITHLAHEEIAHVMAKPRHKRKWGEINWDAYFFKMDMARMLDEFGIDHFRPGPQEALGSN